MNPKPSRYQFVALEGLDGVGKSSIARELTQHLRYVGQPSKLVEMPAEQFREASSFVNRHASTGVHYLFYLAVVKHASDQARAQLANAHLVCPRYILSTLVYHQAADVGIDVSVAQLDLVIPDLTILLHCEEHERQNRVRSRGKSNTRGDLLALDDSPLLQRISCLYRTVGEAFNLIEIDTTGLTHMDVVRHIATIMGLPDA